MSLAPSLLNLSRTGLPPIEFFALIFPLSLLHSKPLRPIVWAVGWPVPLQRRHYIDGQFDDADFKAEAWTCVSPECNNIFLSNVIRFPVPWPGPALALVLGRRSRLVLIG